MDFAAAWDAAIIGSRIVVSDGQPEPPGGLGLSIWKSHNFEGDLVEFNEGPPRTMKIEQDPGEFATVAYDVREDVPHSFVVDGVG